MLNNFEQKKRRKMTKLWRKHFEKHKHGFEMFTSRLYEDAPALVIGYNPGGELHRDKMSRRVQQFTNGDFSRPTQITDEDKGKHYRPQGLPDYASNSAIPGRIKREFFNGKQKLLEQTVETNRYYMRTGGKSKHRNLLKSLSGEAFEEYMRFCRETTYETIRGTNPDVVIDFANQHDGRASEFCADIGFEYGYENEYTHEDGGSVDGRVSVVKMTEPPHSKVISVKPHLSAAIAQPILDLFSKVIPPRLRD